MIEPGHDTLAPKSRDNSPYRQSDTSLVKDLIKKRGILKGRLTRFANYVSNLKNETICSKKQIDLKLRIQGASTMFGEFNNIQTKLEESVSDIDDQLTQRELFESSYYNAISEAEYLLSLCKDTDTLNPSAQKPTIKLPVISLPIFDGSIGNWLQFRDSYISLVHNSSEISDIEKFHYLKSSLKGSAELVINSVEFSASHYLIAWELLQTRFNNQRLLVQNHVKALFTMNSISKESHIQIRNLIDTVLKNIRALSNLNEPVEYWDTLLIYLIVSKLDPSTEREWEQHKGTLCSKNDNSSTSLKLDSLMKFLTDRADMLETLQLSHSKQNHNFKKLSNQNSIKVHCNVSTNKPKERQLYNNTKKRCLLCNASHPLYACQTFLDYNLETKLKFINDKKLCINCLRLGHTVSDCRFGPCRRCNQKHNSLVHPDNNYYNINTTFTSHASNATEVSDGRVLSVPPAAPEIVRATAPAPSAASPFTPYSSTHASSINANNAHLDTNCVHSANLKPVLLSTALIQITDDLNKLHVVRALLDNGSERCFITKSLCDLLHINVIQSTFEIRGVGNSVTKSTQICDVEIVSTTNTYKTQLQCFVLPNITSAIPAMPLQYTQFNIPDYIQLADPQFYKTSNIDILIGADKFWDLIKTDKIKLPNGPFLLDTELGWIISGPIFSISRNKGYGIQCNFSDAIDTQLRQFWELEETFAPRDTHSEDERACEQHFVNNTTRTIDGRFVVRIPFKISPDKLGETYSQAERRFLALEKRLVRNPEYKKLYCDFIHEYIRLGHMKLADNYGKPHYIMPHHGVLREHSTTTKLRVVFDGSAKSSTGSTSTQLVLMLKKCFASA
ncbi:uncharacterized protein LOC123657615 [Melitaea cinxia]|uniref:uncharacterized protein LOC123657615 n=1 Tax=Melitaea cinxia TaxID=113334 RepID=UPI001E26FBB5|nr:uncharacterized protein LOC123657615 [Melitaea cinxia]